MATHKFVEFVKFVSAPALFARILTRVWPHTALAFGRGLNQAVSMSPLVRFWLLLCLGLPTANSREIGGWRSDGYHVFPGGDLQAALDQAAANPTNKVVRVHAGVYQPKGAAQALIWFNRVHDGIHMQAMGEVILSAVGNEPTDGQKAARKALVNHVVYFGDGVGQDTVLEGFRITGANHFVTTQPPGIEPCSTFKKDLFFYADGGAIKIFGHSSPTLRRLEIVDNYASPCAGGISVQQQWPAESTAPAPVRIESCLFYNNRSQITGAAVDLLPGSSAVISNCLFIGNVANLGINYLSANQAQPEFTNSAPLTVFPTSSVLVQHCTFTGNRNGVDDLGHRSVYANCLFWRNGLGGAYYAGERYDLDLEDAAQVTGCVFGGQVIDRRKVISKATNAFDAPDPRFDAQFRPTAPEYADAGIRSPMTLPQPIQP